MKTSCNYSCALCPNEKFYYINFSKIHGLCSEHSIPKGAIIRCTKCTSVVPVLTYTPIITNCCFCKALISEPAHTCSEPVCKNCFDYSDACPSCFKDFVIFNPDPPARPIKKLEFKSSQILISNNKIKLNFSKIESADAKKKHFELVNVNPSVNKIEPPLQALNNTQTGVGFVIKEADGIKKDNVEYKVQTSLGQRFIKLLAAIFSGCSLCSTRQETL